MDSELQKVIIRYLIVAIAISVAATFTVFYFADRRHPNGVPLVVGSDAGPDEKPSAAPSVQSMFVTRDGAERVLCKQACRLEAYCDFRSVEDCMAKSCDGDLRIPAKSDATFARADDCTAAAQAPCEDACRRRATCGPVDDNCLAICKLRAQQLPGDGYRSARCVLEAKTCAALQGC